MRDISHSKHNKTRTAKNKKKEQKEEERNGDEEVGGKVAGIVLGDGFYTAQSLDASYFVYAMHLNRQPYYLKAIPTIRLRFG